jgi:hypothetical protein
MIYHPLSMRNFIPKKMVFSTWVDHMPFAYDLVAAIRPKMVVELGTHNGLSFFTMCQSMKENTVDGICYAVDTREGDTHTDSYSEEVFTSVQTHLREEYKGIAYMMRMLFNDALAHFSDESVDLLHIDGLHTYEAVSEDFNNWYPKVKPGGIIIFHDVHSRMMDFGAWKFWEEIAPQYETFTFKHGFGLGVLRKAGGNNPSHPLFEGLFNSSEAEQQQLREMYLDIGDLISFRRRRQQNQLKNKLQQAQQQAAQTAPPAPPKPKADS